MDFLMAGMTPSPRSRESTHPGRISRVRNTETPTESSYARRRAGRPSVRRVESSSGNRMSKKRRSVVESQQETESRPCATPPSSQIPDNWPDTSRALLGRSWRGSVLGWDGLLAGAAGAGPDVEQGNPPVLPDSTWWTTFARPAPQCATERVPLSDLYSGGHRSCRRRGGGRARPSEPP